MVRDGLTDVFVEGIFDNIIRSSGMHSPPAFRVAAAVITRMIEGQGPQETGVTIPASSRATFNMADWIGATDVSIRVEAEVPIICERAMYRDDRREGHASGGGAAAAPDTTGGYSDN